jgi:hypothetical protein
MGWAAAAVVGLLLAVLVLAPRSQVNRLHADRSLTAFALGTR